MSGGLALAALSFVFTAGLLIGLVALFGADYRVEDTGDWFVKAGAVARYAAERLAAATSGTKLPEPPNLLADQVAVRLALVTTLVYEALLVTIAVAVSRQSPAGFVRALGLDHAPPRELVLPRSLARFVGFRAIPYAWVWLAPACALAGYVLIGVYVAVVSALGIDALLPHSTVPAAVTREGVTFALAAGVAALAAPLTEETFFRGFVFTGLLRWGFWPAAAISAALFTLAHLDPGSMIPFFLIGLGLAWVYWARRSLWESIAFHALFNSISLLLLFAGR